MRFLLVSEYLNRLYAEYRRAAKIGADVMDAAASENRDLTPDEITRRDAAYADVSHLKAEIDKVKTFEELRSAADVFAVDQRHVIERARGVVRQPTLRDLFAGARANGFVAADFDPTPAGMTLRSLQSEGGSAVETSFADFVTVYARTMTPMLRPDVVNVINREDGSPLVLPRVSADTTVAGTVTAELAGITVGDPTISQITLSPFKYAVINKWSAELGQDSAISIERTVAETTARSITIAVGGALTTGDGSGDPNGFITAATNGGTASGTGTTYGTYFGPTDLVNLLYGLAGPDRDAASWMANATTIAEIRKSRATTGEPIWQPALAAGQPETLLGKPLYENPAMANGSAAKAVAVGNFKKYAVALVRPRVEASIHAYYGTDEVGLRTIYRVDGDLIEAAAIRYLVNAAV